MAVAIRVGKVSKEYRLGIINHGMLYKDMQSWFARRRGKADPHAKIGKEFRTGGADRFWALRDIALDIEQGDRVGLIGKNGAGKSTLLKILSRITAPTEGRIGIKGRVVSLLEVGTGFHPELTGRENIYLNGAILGMKKREVARKFDEIVAFSEIEQFIDTPVKRFSSGMYVRLAFSVAAHLDAEILLADEVLAVGDAAFQKKCLGKMEDVSRDLGRTVIFVSHNIPMVRTLCVNGLLLAKGVLTHSGTMDSVIDRYMDTGVRDNVVLPDGPVESVRFRQDSGALEFRLAYRDTIEVDVPHVGIKVADSMGTTLFSVNPYNYELTRDGSLGNRQVLVRITEPRLYSGDYRVSLVFADSRMALRKYDNLMQINIMDMAKVNKPVGQSHGAIHPDCEYRYS